jgi:hypothetical protein
MHEVSVSPSVWWQSARRLFKCLTNVGKTSWLCFPILFLSWPVSVARAQCTSSGASTRSLQDETSPMADFHADLDQVTVSHVASDHIQLALSFSVLTDRDVSVREVSFANMRLNELPFYAPPLEDRLKLIAGQRLVLPHQVQATFYYRDLESLRPLELLVREGNARAEGTLYVDLQLNLIDKAVLLARRARMPLAVRKDLPVEIPGGALARTAALGVLSLASQPFELFEGIKLAAATFERLCSSLALSQHPILSFRPRWNSVCRGVHGGRFSHQREAVPPTESSNRTLEI